MFFHCSSSSEASVSGSRRLPKAMCRRFLQACKEHHQNRVMEMLDAHPELISTPDAGNKRNAFHWFSHTNSCVLLEHILQPLLATFPGPGHLPTPVPSASRLKRLAKLLRLSSSSSYPGSRTAPVAMMSTSERIQRCLEAQDSLGRTPVWEAASKGHAKIILLLLATSLSLRVDIPIQDNRYLTKELCGTTPAQVARNLKHLGVAQLLDDYQVDEVGTRNRARIALGLPSSSAGIYSLLVFLHEDLLAIS